MQGLVQDPIAHYPQATVACLDPTSGELPRRELDVQRTQAYLERLAQAGASAFLIGSSTGQGHLRTAGELARWLEIAGEVELGGTLRMALLHPEMGLAANLQLLEQLPAWRYAVVFFRPGSDLPPGAAADRIAEQLEPLVAEAARIGLPVGLYSIPDVSGVRLPLEAILRLLDAPGGEQIVAVKVTEADYETSTLAMLREPRLGRLKIVQGWDPHLARALQDGPRHDPRGRQRCGVTSGPMALAIEQYRHLLAAAERGAWQEVEACQEAVTRLFQSMQDDPRRFADLQRAKYVMGLGHPLTGQVTSDQAERLLAALAGLPRPADRSRLARSLDLMGDGPYHQRLAELDASGRDGS